MVTFAEDFGSWIVAPRAIIQKDNIQAELLSARSMDNEVYTGSGERMSSQDSSTWLPTSNRRPANKLVPAILDYNSCQSSSSQLPDCHSCYSHPVNKIYVLACILKKPERPG